MPLLHLIFMLFIIFTFVWLMFLLSWYVALPLLILGALFGGIRWLYLKIQNWRYRRMANGCTIHRTTATTHTTIIDADYTELP